MYIPDHQLDYIVPVYIKSVLEYACQAFHTSLAQYLPDDIEHIQKRVPRIFYQDLSLTENLK